VVGNLKLFAVKVSIWKTVFKVEFEDIEL